LKQHDLNSVHQLWIGTNEELLTTLDDTSLAAREDKIVAVAARAMKVREEAAKLLLPRAIHITPPQATLKTVDELDMYLTKLRNEIMTHLDAGSPVII
jgi:hypothetical protein